MLNNNGNLRTDIRYNDNGYKNKQYKFFNSILNPLGRRSRNYRYYNTVDENKVIQKYFNDVGQENTFSCIQEIEYSIKIKQLESKRKLINKVLRNTIKSYNQYINISFSNGSGSEYEQIEPRKHIKKKIYILETLYRIVSSKIDIYKSQFASANLKLVISLSKNFINRGLPLSDLIQEGNIGLLKAITKFNHTLGYKFSTYASWWILQSINRSILEQTRLIKLPIRLQEQYTKLNRQKHNLTNSDGYIPTNEEISEISGVNVKKIKKVFKALSISVVSMDAPIYSNNDSEILLKDSFKDPDSTVENTISQIEMTNKVAEAISKLSQREQTILNMRYGIGYNHNCTLDEIGNYYGLTRERIRQIETRALKKIRTNSYGTILREFIE